MAPRTGTFERYPLMELLNYITSEVHKSFAPLFHPATSAELKAATIAAFDKKFKWLTAQIGKKKFLMGDAFTVADAYLFTVLSWGPRLGIDFGKFPEIAAYLARVGERPKVKEALQAEGLSK